MVIKNKKSAFVVSGLIYGCLMALYYVLQGDVLMALNMCLFGSVLYGFLLYLYTVYKEKKAENLRKQIETKRKIICHGGASYRKSSIIAIGGWMFLTEDAVEFYKTIDNLGGKNIAILLDEIISVSMKGKILNIVTKEMTYSFIVPQVKIWKEKIELIVAT